MVFSSVPVYLDPPNWHHQQPNHQQGAGSENPHQLPPIPSAPHHVVGVGGAPGGAGSIRPGSMADRARLAKIPHTEPRHFCKACRRYWTRGGALRNVPVGGGCRRNKKSKSSSSSSKSPANNTEKPQQMGNSNSTSSLPPEIIGHLQQQCNTPHQIPLMPSLHNLSQYNMGSIGLNFGGIGASSGVGSSHSTDHVGFQIGSNSSMSSSAILSAAGGVQQFTFFEPPNTGLYSFQAEGIEAPSSLVVASNPRVSEQAPAKMEDHHQELNLSRPFFGISENNQYWSGNNWTDLSALNNSTSTNHLLENFKL
ncbi:hypothetical protein AB3S75_039240 [Citrus x aurantiifolia]